MARPPHRRNEKHSERRAELLDALSEALLVPDGPRKSLRALAREVGVTPPTLRHYFSTHQGLLGAVLAHLAGREKARLRRLGDDALPLEASLDSLIAALRRSWASGLGAAYALGTRLPKAQSSVFVDHLVEPWLHAVEARLARHMANGELRTVDVRHAALAFLGPILLALLVSDTWGAARKVDLEALVAMHRAAFVAAHRP